MVNLYNEFGEAGNKKKLGITNKIKLEQILDCLRALFERRWKMRTFYILTKERFFWARNWKKWLKGKSDENFFKNPKFPLQNCCFRYPSDHRFLHRPFPKIILHNRFGKICNTTHPNMPQGEAGQMASTPGDPKSGFFFE